MALRLCFLASVLLPATLCGSSNFNELWNDVTSKINSKDSGVGPFENAEVEFGPKNKLKRFDYFKLNRVLERTLPNVYYKTTLNFFALLDKSEWARYISAPNMHLITIWSELYKFLQQPTTIAKMERYNDYNKVNVRTRHSGAYPSGGLMAGVMQLEYLYKSLLDIPQSDISFSSQYFLNCIKVDDPKYRPVWPYEVWTQLESNHFAARDTSTGMSWSGQKGKCENVQPNSFEEHVSVTASHMMSPWQHVFEEHLRRGPVTVCVYVDVKTPSFFFYSSGLYTDLVFGGIFTACNHFVLFVSYSEKYMVLHNTWGRDWGVQGRMKISRGHIARDQLFLVSFPTLKYDEPTFGMGLPGLMFGRNPNSKFGSTIQSRYEFTEVRSFAKVIYHKDYFLSNAIEVNQTFIITSTSIVEQDKRFLAVGFMTLGHTSVINYGVMVNFTNGKILQFVKLGPNDNFEVKEKLIEDMKSPKSTPNITIIRIRVEEDHFITLLNDQPLEKFPHKSNLYQINLVESHGDGELKIEQQTQSLVPVIQTNSGGEDATETCRNKDLDQDCELWRSYGYCESSSRYQQYMLENCQTSCGVC